MHISEQQQMLFTELRKTDPDIIMDGIVDENYYLSAKYKIVYILKEVNGGQGWNLTDFLKNGGRPQTWNNIARWTEAILEIGNGVEKDWNYWLNNNEERRLKYLRYIGAINLKKTSGTYASNGKEIFQAALNNRDIVKKQIDLYQPNIIICCGTGDAFADTYFAKDETIQWKSTKRGIWYIKQSDKIIISFSHPAARVAPSLLHYGLIDAVQEILQI